jgi:hypothetical protein
MSKLLPGGRLGGVSKLVGTHYEIVSMIFRALGAKVGKRVYWPGSGLEIVEYDLLEVGNDVVFGSRSVVLTSSAERSAPVIFEDGCMIADRCVILPGLHLKKGTSSSFSSALSSLTILSLFSPAAVLGSGSLSPEDFVCPVGSIWVGSRDGSCINVSPEDMTYAIKDTITPFGRAFYEGKAPYRVIPLWGVVCINLCWSAVCTCYHNAPTVLALSAVNFVHKFDRENIHRPIELFQLLFIAFVPVFFTMSLLALAFSIAVKWQLLGRRKQGPFHFLPLLLINFPSSLSCRCLSLGPEQLLSELATLPHFGRDPQRREWQGRNPGHAPWFPISGLVFPSPGGDHRQERLSLSQRRRPNDD